MEAKDYLTIANLVGGFGNLVDKREWDKAVQLFAPVVEVDYTSLFGGSAQEQKREDLVYGWSQFLPRFTCTEHHIAQPYIEINGEKAIARAAVVAYHFTGESLQQQGSEWVIGGHYRFIMKKTAGEWKIQTVILQALWQKGTPPN